MVNEVRGLIGGFSRFENSIFRQASQDLEMDRIIVWGFV